MLGCIYFPKIGIQTADPRSDLQKNIFISNLKNLLLPYRSKYIWREKKG